MLRKDDRSSTHSITPVGHGPPHRRVWVARRASSDGSDPTACGPTATCASGVMDCDAPVAVGDVGGSMDHPLFTPLPARPAEVAAVLNMVWVGLIVAGVVVAALQGHVQTVTTAAFDSAKLAVETVIALTGILIFWLGIARVAEKAGLMESLTRVLRPVFLRLFPSLSSNSPALSAILLNVSANMLGLGQAATPFGLKAMQELQAVNDQPDRETASDAMVTFLVLNTAGITLIPATVIAYRAAAGSQNPTEIVGVTLAASVCSTVLALVLDRLLRRSSRTHRQH